MPAALRRTTTPSSPSGVRAPPSKHRQASQPAKRSVWPNGAVRHSSSQTSSSADLGVVLRARGERAQDAEREHDAALHVDRAGADELVAVALERRGGRRARSRCRGGRAAGCGRAPVPREPGDQVVGVVGGGAGDALELGVVGRERGADRRRTPRRRGGRRWARRRRRAPPARAARGGRSPASTWRPTRPWPGHATRLPSMGDARAARDGDHRPPRQRGADRRDDRVGGGAGHQRAEDVRPAAVRARGRDDRRRAAARQAADARRRRADAADAPDERGAAAAVPQARHDARPHDARRPAAVRGPRAAAARVRDEAARVGEAAARPRRSTRTRRSRGSGRRRGPTRRSSASCWTRRGRCTRCCATSR